MKKTNLLWGAVLSLGLIGCGSDNNTSSSSFNFPTSSDSAEAGLGDNTEDNATPIQLNTSYKKTNFPAKDDDWVSIQLTEGVKYELTANAICPTCDTEMFLSEKVDGQYYEIDSNDDRNEGYDSGIEFTPERTDTYYINVIALDYEGVTSYSLNAHEFIDNDEDGYSNFFDCNDNDASIYPYATEVVEDSIDQDCNGSDLIAVTTEDRFENDDTFDNASPVIFLDYHYTEAIYFFQQYQNEIHTAHHINDVDWLSVTLPANSSGRLRFDQFITGYDNTFTSLTFFESDGTTAASYIPLGETEPREIGQGSYQTKLVNTLDEEKIYLIKVNTGSPDTGYYMPLFEFTGFDNDKDGYYSMEGDSDYDCDDTSAYINPGATDIAEDGIDQDCDGDDDSNISFNP